MDKLARLGDEHVILKGDTVEIEELEQPDPTEPLPVLKLEEDPGGQDPYNTSTVKVLKRRDWR